MSLDDDDIPLCDCNHVLGLDDYGNRVCLYDDMFLISDIIDEFIYCPYCGVEIANIKNCRR